MCYHKIDAVAEKTVGDLTVRVVYDDIGYDRWSETKDSADAADLLWVPDHTKRQDSGDLAPRAPFAGYDPQFSEDEICNEVADWYHCDYRCGDGSRCRDCQDREDRNEILASYYFFETGYVGNSNGWFVGLKTDFADLAQFEARCESICAEYRALSRGEVYGYEVVNEDGDVLESCWGFIGEDDYCMAQGVEVAEALIKDAAETAHICEPYAAAGNGD